MRKSLKDIVPDTRGSDKARERALSLRDLDSISQPGVPHVPK